MNGTVDFDKLAYDYVMLYVTPWEVIGAGGRGFPPSTAPVVQVGLASAAIITQRVEFVGFRS